MKCRNMLFRVTSIILTIIILLFTATSSFAASEISWKTKNDEAKTAAALAVADNIVEIARAEIGFVDGENINKFTTWYYGYDTSAYWCSIFISWCADQAGALGTAIPKRASCVSMKNWFEIRGEYYPASSDYVPQKGDIMFINTAVDGTDNIHHVDLITESGFIGSGNNKKVKCISGNTSNLNYEGSEYVTEKERPVSGPKACVVGYAHPSYTKSTGVMGDIETFTEANKLPFMRFLESKMISFLYNLENLWANTVRTFRMQVADFETRMDATHAKIESDINAFKENNKIRFSKDTAEEIEPVTETTAEPSTVPETTLAS